MGQMMESLTMFHAIDAGYPARHAGCIPRTLYATASSPVEGTIVFEACVESNS